MATLETRRALLSDARIMSRLCMQLGYDCDEVAMRRRLDPIRDELDHAVFVAAIDGHEVVGWIHLALRNSLVRDPHIEVVALVVASNYRRMGIGRALMDRAESWTESQGITGVSVDVGGHREEAMAFFEALGYAAAPQQRVFHRKVETVDVTGTPTLVD